MLSTTLAPIESLFELIFSFRSGGEAAAPKTKNSECGKRETAPDNKSIDEIYFKSTAIIPKIAGKA